MTVKLFKAAFLWGWLTGFLLLGTHFWLMHVTLPEIIVLNVSSRYFGLFRMGYSIFQNVALKHPTNCGSSKFMGGATNFCVIGCSPVLAGLVWGILSIKFYHFIQITNI